MYIYKYTYIYTYIHTYIYIYIMYEKWIKSLKKMTLKNASFTVKKSDFDG